ncbi:MAG TPA: EAL domain-containing protein [Steroidobacteraceae bacterium]|nr:EAL domain-containing protein [Steroidobacteraceae bacterium]
MDQGKPLTATDSPLVDFDAVCQKVRAAVEPARTHAVSLHDELGDVLWLSESSMGPDEHNAVLQAAETFVDPSAAAALAIDLGDLRSAVLIRAVNTRSTMVGVIMIIMDTRIVAQGAIKLLTPKMQRALTQFAAMRPDRGPAPSPEPEPVAPARTPAASGRPPSPAAAPAQPAPRTAAPPARAAPPPAKTTPPSAARSAAPDAAPPRPTMPAAAPTLMPFSSGPRSISAQVQQIVSRPAPRPASPASTPAKATPPHSASPARPSSPPPTAPPPSIAPTSLEPPAIVAASPSIEIFEKLPKGVTPEIDRLHAALRKSPIALHVQRLVPLSKGGQLKRYEVLLRSGSEESPNAAPHAMLKAAVDNGLGSMIDRRVLTELISWLIRHPESCVADEVMFSVNLTVTALHDEHFIKFVELCLTKSSLPKATIAFEVDASTALSLADKINDVAVSLHRLGCPLILDDFALRTECFALLRLPGVRYVKLAPDMTAKMRIDKISQAAITGVVQMARVLGMHTVAKRTETAAEQEWLTALGVDFVQSNFISPPVAIDNLLKPETSKN